MIIYSTNLANSIDPAIINRSKLVQFPAPSPEIAAKTFNLYIKKAELFNTMIIGNLSNERIMETIGNGLQGMTQRQIMKLATEIIEEIYLSETQTDLKVSDLIKRFSINQRKPT